MLTVNIVQIHADLYVILLDRDVSSERGTVTLLGLGHDGASFGVIGEPGGRHDEGTLTLSEYGWREHSLALLEVLHLL
jgi:hypothetical protein